MVAVGDTLELVSLGTYTHHPVLTIRWERDMADIPGADQLTYTCVEADVGAMLRARVTATNSAGSVSAWSNSLGPVEEAPVEPVAPEFVVDPSISGDAVVGGELTVDVGTITGTPTPSVAIQWERV